MRFSASLTCILILSTASSAAEVEMNVYIPYENKTAVDEPAVVGAAVAVQEDSTTTLPQARVTFRADNPTTTSTTVTTTTVDEPAVIGTVVTEEPDEGSMDLWGWLLSLFKFLR